LFKQPGPLLKNIFKYKKTRYKGLAKNDAQLNVLFALKIRATSSCGSKMI